MFKVFYTLFEHSQINKVVPLKKFMENYASKAARCIWALKAKTDYLVLDAKLLLINMNHIIFFFFFESL